MSSLLMVHFPLLLCDIVERRSQYFSEAKSWVPNCPSGYIGWRDGTTTLCYSRLPSPVRNFEFGHGNLQPPKIWSTNTRKPLLLSCHLSLSTDGRKKENLLFPMNAIVVLGIKIAPCMGYGLITLGVLKVRSKKSVWVGPFIPERNGKKHTLSIKNDKSRV